MGTAWYSGTHYVQLRSLNGRFGYTLSVNIIPAPTHDLTVVRAGTGNGSITVDPAGSSCGTDCTSHTVNNIITLTATPSAGSFFNSWSGACAGTDPVCLVTMNGPTEVTAQFTLITPATSTTLAASPAVKQQVGQPVTLTAQASGGTGNYEYQFRLKTGTAWTTPQAFGPLNTFDWTPAQTGIYTIQVRARNAGSTAAYEAYRNLTYTVVQSPPVTGVSLTTDQHSPAQYSTLDVVQYTALATGGTGTYQYKFMVKDSSDNVWTTPQDWGDSPVFDWTPGQVGSYTIQVRARNAGSVAAYEAYLNVTFVVIEDDPVTSVSLAITNGKKSPAVLDTVGAVQFQAVAAGSTENYEYWFRVKNNAGTVWTTLRVYDAQDTIDWAPTQAGSYTIQVRARNAGSVAASEAYRNITFSVVTESPVTDVSLTSDKTSPKTLSAAGTVTFNALATGTTNSCEYQFMVKSSVTGLWTVPQGWSNDGNFPWTPDAAGTYTVQVRARNAGSPAAYEAYRSKTFSITN
jgi:hypothetical protein